MELDSQINSSSEILQKIIKTINFTKMKICLMNLSICFTLLILNSNISLTMKKIKKKLHSSSFIRKQKIAINFWTMLRICSFQTSMTSHTKVMYRISTYLTKAQSWMAPRENLKMIYITYLVRLSIARKLLILIQ